MEQKIKKWQKHLRNLVYSEVFNMNLRKHTFNIERKIIQNNPKITDNNIFIIYLFKNYAEAQVLSITRIVESYGRNTMSFVSLLDDMLSNYEEVINLGELDQVLIDEINKTNLDKTLKEIFIKKRKDNKPSWEKINSDKFDLLKETAKIKLLRDKWIAHIDKERKPIKIDYDEINRIIDLLNEKIKEYYILLFDQGWTTLTPGGSEGDEKIFNFPWSLN